MRHSINETHINRSLHSSTLTIIQVFHKQRRLPTTHQIHTNRNGVTTRILSMTIGGGPDSDDDDPTKHRAFLFGTTISKKKPREGRRRHRNQPRRSQRQPHDHPQNNQRAPPGNPNDTPGGSTGVKVIGNPNYWTQKYTREQRDVEERIYTKGRAGISHKIKWDENAESFQTYERLVSNHCQQHDLGYLLIPHFMTMYIRHGTSVFDRVPQYKQPGMTVQQFLRDNNALYGILQSVFNVGIGIQIFHTPIQVQGYFDGIQMYVKIVNQGPTVSVDVGR
jgi:hypothetical protein